MLDLEYEALMGTKGLEDCSRTGLLLKQDSRLAFMPIRKQLLLLIMVSSNACLGVFLQEEGACFDGG